MRALESVTGHVIYNPAFTYKFQLKTTFIIVFEKKYIQRSYIVSMVMRSHDHLRTIAIQVGNATRQPWEPAPERS